jgi:Uncharacterised nucleotidyltransferase
MTAPEQLMAAGFRPVSLPNEFIPTEHDITFATQRRMAAVALALWGERISDDQRRQLSETALNQLVVTRRALALAFKSQQLLDGHNIASVAVKGVALHQSHEAIHTRHMGDVDILVHPRNYLRAIRLFAQDGCRGDEYYQTMPRISAFMGGSTNMAYPDGTEVDVHKVVGPWAFGSRLKFNDVLVRSVLVDTTVGTLRVAQASDLMLITCSSIIGDWGTRYAKTWAWRDIILLMGVVPAAEMRAHAERYRLDWLVADLAAHIDADLVPDGWLDHFAGASPSRVDRWRANILRSELLRRRLDMAHAVRMGAVRGTMQFGRDFGVRQVEKVRGRRVPQP